MWYVFSIRFVRLKNWILLQWTWGDQLKLYESLSHETQWGKMDETQTWAWLWLEHTYWLSSFTATCTLSKYHAVSALEDTQALLTLVTKTVVSTSLFIFNCWMLCYEVSTTAKPCAYKHVKGRAYCTSDWKAIVFWPRFESHMFQSSSALNVWCQSKIFSDIQ